MANIKKFIKKAKLKTRVLSVVLVIAILCGSLVWFGNNDMGNVAAEGKDKEYIEYIVERITKGTQDKFRILEIVPYDGMGEFRYFLNDTNVVSKLEEKINSMTDLEERNNFWCSEEDTDWKILQGTGFGAFGYQVRYNKINENGKKFEVKGDDSFLQKMFGDQAGVLSRKIQLDTVEAKDLTADMINAADFIVFSSSHHDDGTLKLYEAWTGNDSYSAGIDLSTEPYSHAGRDMNFTALKALLDCTVKGRSILLPNGSTKTLKTPVILDNSDVSGLDPKTNVYKFNLVYRTLCGVDVETIDDGLMVAAYENLIGYLGSNQSIEFGVEKIKAYLKGTCNYYNFVGKDSDLGSDSCFDGNHNNWLTDYFFCYDGKALLGQKVPESDVIYYKNTNNWSNVYMYCSNDESSISGGIDSGNGTLMTELSDGTYKCKTKPKTTKVNFHQGGFTGGTGDLVISADSNFYANGTWGVYNEPAVEADYEGVSSVTARTGNTTAKLENVLQFLLGSKSNQINKSYDYGHTTVDGSGGVGSMNKIYFDNSATNWSNVYAYMWGDSSNNGWTGTPQMTNEGSNLYSIDVPSEYNKVIFKSSSGDISGDDKVNRTGDISIQKGKKFIKNSGEHTGQWVDYAKSGTWSSNSLKVLEVQPCTSFTYDDLENVKLLGEKLLMQGYSSWDDAGGNNDYRHYIDVTCVTTNALNGMSNDLISDFDVIIIGENTGILKLDSNNKTIYNDRTLNGYVYLAFGDLFKINTNALGLLPNEYVELTSDGTTMSEENKNKYTEYIYEHFKDISAGNVLILHNMGYMYGNHGNDGKGEDSPTYPYGYRLNSSNFGYGNDGKFYSDYKLGNVRGADNDITEVTRKELIKFAESGKTIILSDSLYDLDGLTVYPTSSMYKLCKELGKMQDDGITRLYGVYSESNMSGAVNHRATRNPIIEMKTYPTPPTYDSNGIVNSYGSRDIKFNFDITGQPGATYRIKLYVDKNSDGVYRGIEEGISDDRNELYFSREVTFKDSAGTPCNFMNYDIDSELSDNFVGMLAWKIEVVELKKVGNNWVETSYLNSVKGYSAIKNETDKLVNVLQIMPDRNGTLDMDSGTYAFKPLLEKIKQSGIGYNIIVESISVSEFEKKYDPANAGIPYNGAVAEPVKEGYIYFRNDTNWSAPRVHYWGDGVGTNYPGVEMEKVPGTTNIYYIKISEKVTGVKFNGTGNGEHISKSEQNMGFNKMYISKGKENGEWVDYTYFPDPVVKPVEPVEPVDYLKDYHMVVIGFGDRFGDDDISNKYGALDNIVDYINSGKAVLFTHDTLSWRATPNYKAYGDKGGGSYGAIGMDKTNLQHFNGNSGATSYHDNFAYNITLSLRNAVGMDKYGVTLVDKKGHEQPTYASTAVSPSYNGTSLKVEEIHGFTPWFIYRNNFLETFVSNYSSSNTGTGMYSIKPFKDGLCSDDYFNYDLDGPWTTKKVSQLNEGAITMYPYNIDKSLSVASTHAQYYSLNMEDEDVVVWYTLAGDGSSDSTYYGLTDKDAENNYYIYSKNNITYSGAGHSAMSSTMENKLFVNTVIKAIAGGNSSPVLKITNGSVGDGGMHTVRVNSGDTAENYEIHLYGKDADLVGPESIGIDHMIREVDLNKYEGTSVIGKFKWAKVYWDDSNNPDTPIFTYDGETSNTLRNGVIKEIKLGESSVLKNDSTIYHYDTDGDGVDENLGAFKYIEYLVEGNPLEENPIGANFTIEVSDWLGAKTTIKVKIVERDMFILE